LVANHKHMLTPTRPPALMNRNEKGDYDNYKHKFRHYHMRLVDDHMLAIHSVAKRGVQLVRAG
jgi:hypothetical protein